MHYWDTSTLAKLYVNEPDSNQFSAHVSATGLVTSSELARWELFRLLVRKETDGLLPAGAAEVIFARFEADITAGLVVLLPLDRAVEVRFHQLLLRLHRLSPPLLARTYDAIHLATADLHGAREVVVSDANLRRCVVALGLKLFP